MSETPRRRYQIRLRKALAGSFLAAATAATLTGFAAAPALAVPPRVLATSTDTADHESSDSTLALDPAVTVASPTAVAVPAQSSTERLAGVRADLDRAVLLRMVTLGQADAFYAQIERRVAAGR